MDTVYHVTDADGRRAISTDRAFLLFACEVGRHFGETTIFGRALRTDVRSDYTLPDGVGLAELPHYPSLRHLGRVLAAAWGTARAMWRNAGAVDALWVFGPGPFGLLLIAIARMRRRGVVVGVRQDTVAYYRARLPSGRWLPLLAPAWLLEQGYLRTGRRFGATTVGDEISARYGSARDSVVPMTVSLVPERDLATAPPERDWEGTIELLTVGRLDPEKNPLLLVDAVAELTRAEPGRYSLTWLGRGPLEADVRRRIGELGLAGTVDLRGYLPFGPAVLDLYRRAHVFVHVSLTEGLPQVLVEALACGTPIVATDVGGVRGALADGGAGLLVPPGDLRALVDAIRLLASDRALRDRLVLRGIDLAAGLTLERQAERIASFLARRFARQGVAVDPRERPQEADQHPEPVREVERGEGGDDAR